FVFFAAFCSTPVGFGTRKGASGRTACECGTVEPFSPANGGMRPVSKLRVPARRGRAWTFDAAGVTYESRDFTEGNEDSEGLFSFVSYAAFCSTPVGFGTLKCASGRTARECGAVEPFAPATPAG